MKARSGNGAARRLGPLLLAATSLFVLLGNECDESEPNDSAATANRLRASEYGNGAIDPAGDTDFWRLENGEAGDLLFGFVDTVASTSSVDSFLGAIADDGTTLFDFDHDSGTGVTAAIASVVPQAGDVYLGVQEDGNDAPISNYRLFHALVSPADVDPESEPNGAPSTDPITASAMTGTVALGFQDLDFFHFDVLAPSRVVLIGDDDPNGDGINTDTEYALSGADPLTPLPAASGDNEASNPTNALGYSISTPGRHHVGVFNGAASGGTDYRFVLLLNGTVYQDTDQDGFPDPDDNCPGLANADQADSDADGAGNVCDDCPVDAIKIDGFVCGCDQPDVDVDGDQLADCDLDDPAVEMLERRGILLVTQISAQRVMAFDPDDGDPVDLDFIPSDPTNLPNPMVAILAADGASILVSDELRNAVQRYDFDGNFLGTFAPAGGPNTAILQEPSGMVIAPNGDLLVTVKSGANGGSVARFGANGAYLGNFVAKNAGGLAEPVDIQRLPNGHYLVNGTNDAEFSIFEYDANGAFLRIFGTIGQGTTQLALAQDGNVLLGGGPFADRGVVEFLPNGTRVGVFTPDGLTEFTGVAELGNGNLLITARSRQVTGGTDGLAPGGVYEVTRTGELVGTELERLAAISIERVPEPGGGATAAFAMLALMALRHRVRVRSHTIPPCPTRRSPRVRAST